jgi:hypothetical protein
MSCRSGKRLIRRFFDEADSDPGCRSEADRAAASAASSAGEALRSTARGGGRM